MLNAFFLLLATLGLRAQRRVQVTGVEALAGCTGYAVEGFEHVGMVRVLGELWQAETTGSVVEKGQEVKITGYRNLVLLVEPNIH